MAWFRPARFLKLLLLGIFFCAAASGQVIGTGAVTVALTGKVAKNIIDDARLAASTLLGDARNTGNALITRGADELNVSTDNAIRLLGANVDRKFEDLADHERRLLTGLAQATVAVKDLANKAYLAKDTLSLDVRSILGNLPLTDEVFVLQRVDGLTQLEKEGMYSLQVIGSYVGLPATGYKTSISLRIDGRPVENLRIDPKEVHVAVVNVPASALKPYLKTATLSIVPATLVVDYTHPDKKLGVIPTTRTERAESRIHFVLYPAFAGEMNVAARWPVMGWTPIADDSSRQTGPNAHCARKCKKHHGIAWDFTMPVSGGVRQPQIEGDIRIVGARCTAVAGPSGFDMDISTAIEANATRARCNVRARSHPVTYQLTVARERWGAKSDGESASKLAMRYDETAELRVPKETKLVRVSGQTLAGDKFDGILGEPDPANPVQLVRRVENTADMSYFVKLARPRALD